LQIPFKEGIRGAKGEERGEIEGDLADNSTDN
jgi:hypothetical protein